MGTVVYSDRRAECIRLKGTMRTIFLSCLALVVAPLDAQSVTLTSPTDLLHAPNGRAVATIRTGGVLALGANRSGYVAVTIEGYVPASALGAKRDSFPFTIKDGSTELRRTAAISGASIASLRQGMGVMEVRRNGDWVLVRRSGWIRQPSGRSANTDSTRAPVTKAATTPPPVRPAPAPPSGPAVHDAGAAIPDSASLVVAAKAAIRESPGGRPMATLTDSSRIESLYRERGWVRVRLEGWVRESDVHPADSAMKSALLPSDLRADPDGTRGKLVRWEVQMLAIQAADPLQKDLTLNEPYLLARGPGADHALVYLALPTSLVESARRLPPLSFVTVVARVRNGRSAPGGVPILDIQSLITK